MLHLPSRRRKAPDPTTAGSNPVAMQVALSNTPLPSMTLAESGPSNSTQATNLHVTAIPPAVSSLPSAHTAAALVAATPTPSAPSAHQAPTVSVLIPTNSLVSSPAPATFAPALKYAQVSTTLPVSLQFSNPSVLEKALEKLTQQEHDVLNIHTSSSNADAGLVLTSALNKAKRNRKCAVANHGPAESGSMRCELEM
jgi:hypothetical protein